jgi:hypothetical protein
VTKPQPYKFCEQHMQPDIGPNRCKVCFGPVANPVNDEPVQKVNTTSSSTKPPESAGIVQQNVVEPVLTDPTAQKIMDAAKRYAEAREAVKIISEQLREAKELVAAFEKQLKGNQEIADAAQNELREATGVKSA